MKIPTTLFSPAMEYVLKRTLHRVNLGEEPATKIIAEEAKKAGFMASELDRAVEIRLKELM